LEDYKLSCQSSLASTNQFCPNITGIDAINSIGKVAPSENPLFCPFPLQGRPLLDVGPLLESLGFTVLRDFLESQNAAHPTDMEDVKTERVPADES
jgi:hypothetical protein